MTTLRKVQIATLVMVGVLLAGVGYVIWQGQQIDNPQRLATAAIGGPFTLIDQNGATVTEAALDGHPTALFFGYTFCPDVCPTTLFEATMWLEKLGPDADELKVFFVTVDPQRDTRDVLASYLSAFDPRIVGLTGSPEAIEEMIGAYHIYAGKVPLDSGGYLMDHSASVYLLNSDAEFTGTIAYQEDPDIALEKLQRLIDAS